MAVCACWRCALTTSLSECSVAEKRCPNAHHVHTHTFHSRSSYPHAPPRTHSHTHPTLTLTLIHPLTPSLSCTLILFSLPHYLSHSSSPHSPSPQVRVSGGQGCDQPHLPRTPAASHSRWVVVKLTVMLMLRVVVMGDGGVDVDAEGGVDADGDE